MSRLSAVATRIGSSSRANGPSLLRASRREFVPRPCLTVRLSHSDSQHGSSCKPTLVHQARAANHPPLSRSASAASAVPNRADPQAPVIQANAKDLPQTGMDESKVAIGWPSGTWSRFHHVWLRDHCRCPECFHPITKQRLLDTFAIPPDIQPTKVEARVEGLEVTWPSSPAHVSVYPWDWLMHNSYDPPLGSNPFSSSEPRDGKILWGSRIQKDPPTVVFDEVMRDDHALYRWLKKIDQFGFCFISGVPVTPEDTEKLSQRIAKIRETHYGGFWDFTSDLAKGDTAYTTLALRAHTDTTYYTDPCGLQLFHLLSHTDGSGGSSLLVDGFYAASILKELHPDSYNLLSSIKVPTHSAGDSTSLYRPTPNSGYPILNHDSSSGELIQVRYNNDDRSVMKGLNPSTIEPWYQALRDWNKCLTSPDSEYWVQLTPGTAVVVDNHRVLHGRSAFDGKRRMCGAYIGADDYKSKLAVLAELYKDRNNRASDVKKERSVWDPAF